MARLLARTTFQKADRRRALLRFVVDAALDRPAAEIKESVIAVEAFGRSPSFDPKADPIVRVEAGRLRTRLKTYYDSEGVHDTILINLPKGGYTPEFTE